MKLFLTWLLGVPLLVLAMVIARAMSPLGLRVAHQPQVSVCAGQFHVDGVRTAVAHDRHDVTCKRDAIN